MTENEGQCCRCDWADRRIWSVTEWGKGGGEFGNKIILYLDSKWIWTTCHGFKLAWQDKFFSFVPNSPKTNAPKADWPIDALHTKGFWWRDILREQLELERQSASRLVRELVRERVTDRDAIYAKIIVTNIFLPKLSISPCCIAYMS